MLSILYRLSCVMAIFVVIDAINKEERQTLLDCHNYRRAQLALGKYMGQPAAADMTLMDYDVKIEARAQSWSSKCSTGHDTNANRLVSEYKSALPQIGQNAAWNSAGSSIDSGCNGWWDEYKVYNHASNVGSGVVGHYTQMAWAKSTLLGCGVRGDCTNDWKSNAFCNYAIAGNMMGERPYKSGAPCSKCPDGYNMCMDGALCARPDQCKAIGAKCKCAITCENGGTMQNGCSCKCPSGWFGARCQNKCKDSESWCVYPSVDCGNPGMARVCQKKCNKCVTKKPFISTATGGVISRIKKETTNESGGGGGGNGGGAGNDGGAGGADGRDCSLFCMNGGVKYCRGESYVVKNGGHKFKCTCASKSSQCDYLGPA